MSDSNENLDHLDFDLVTVDANPGVAVYEDDSPEDSFARNVIRDGAAGILVNGIVMLGTAGMIFGGAAIANRVQKFRIERAQRTVERLSEKIQQNDEETNTNE